MNISLAGKVAVITGAASGIGLAAVKRFLECGAAGVVAVDRHPHPPHEPESRLVSIRADVAEESCAEEFTRVAIDRFGRIDILISNAAVSVVRAIHEHTPAEWDSVMNVNVKALYWAARHVIPVMIGQRGGLFLITGSISGEAGIPAQGAYAASKGALHQMTRQMAIEYAKYNIRVNAIACGTVDTPLVHSSAKDSGDEKGFWDMLRRRHPIGRIATAEEVASFFAFMASDYATFFTGSVLMMDGGYTAE
jgi:NAD(P)-dependent dehydrogenase (short-subunit alcohol dehydrogenase family)